MKKELSEIMTSVPYVKKLAKNAELYASFIPVVGSIEILDKDKHIGISHDGRSIILQSGIKENLEKWLKAMIIAKQLTTILNKN